MDRLLNFYWTKQIQMLIFKVRFFIYCFFIFYFVFLFLFSFINSYFISLFQLKKDGATPLCAAAYKGHEQIIEILLKKRKPNVDLQDKVAVLFFSFSLFFLCLFFYFLFSFNLLLLNYFPHFIENLIKKHGATPLFNAAFKGHEQCMKILLEKGNPNVNLPDQVFFVFVFC